jgi:hypothetical protein
MKKINYTVIIAILISCTSIQNKSIEGKNDPIIELMTPSKINIVKMIFLTQKLRIILKNYCDGY